MPALYDAEDRVEALGGAASLPGYEVLGKLSECEIKGKLWLISIVSQEALPPWLESRVCLQQRREHV